MLDGKSRKEQRLRNSRGKTKVRRNRRCSIVEQVSTAACGAPVPQQVHVLEGTMTHEDPVLEQSESISERKCYVLTITTIAPHPPVLLEGS